MDCARSGSEASSSLVVDWEISRYKRKHESVVIEAKVKQQRTADQLGRQSGHESMRITSSTDRGAKETWVRGDWTIDYGLAVGTPTASTPPQQSDPSTVMR